VHVHHLWLCPVQGGLTFCYSVLGGLAVGGLPCVVGGPWGGPAFLSEGDLCVPSEAHVARQGTGVVPGACQVAILVTLGCWAIGPVPL